MSIGSKLREKNAAWRERSEAALEKRRTVLDNDWKNHQHGIGELRAAIRNKEPFTIHPPPSKLYESKEAFYFPSVAVRSLGGDMRSLDKADLFKGKRSLVGCAGSRFSEAMVDAWLEGISSNTTSVESNGGASGSPPLQVLRLALVEGTILSLLRMPLLASMRMTVPKSQRDSFFVSFGDTSQMRRQLHVENRYLGYVCLVDEEAVVRWHVHSSEVPSKAQVEALQACL